MTDQSDYRDIRRRRHYRRRSIFFPLLIVALGVFLFLNNLGYIQGNTLDILVRLWPLIFIVGGLDSLLTGGGYVGSIVGITAGSLLLMWNLGYLNILNLDGWQILRLWPILLVAWGLDIVIGRRGVLSALVGIILGLGLAAGGLWLAMNPQLISQPANRESISQSLDGATSASVNIKLGVANVDIGPGAAATDLLQGTLYLQNNDEVNKKYVRQGGNGTFTLNDNGGAFMWIPSSQDAWMLELNQDVPLQLSMKAGAGKQSLDLSRLQVDQLSVELGVGEVDLTLPAESSLRGSVYGAVGMTVIRVPRSTAVRFEIDKAVTTLNYPAGYTLSGNTLTSPAARAGTPMIDLRIAQPVGSITIQEIP
jgi:hypothetical protein